MASPTLPACPVFGMVSPRSAGWLRTLSGVSPCGTCQVISPLSRLTALTVPYGGLSSERPCTVVPTTGAGGGGGGGGVAAGAAAAVAPRPCAGAADGGVAPPGAAARPCGVSAANPSPPPRIGWN